MRLHACPTCGTPSPSRYCPEHRTRRHGSTRAWRRLRAAVLARDGHRCHWCGEPATHVDHLVPVSRGGEDDPLNLVAACEHCNVTRGPRRGVL